MNYAGWAEFDESGVCVRHHDAVILGPLRLIARCESKGSRFAVMYEKSHKYWSNQIDGMRSAPGSYWLVEVLDERPPFALKFDPMERLMEWPAVFREKK